MWEDTEFMDFEKFADELNIKGKVLSVKRRNDAEAYSPVREGCAFRALNNAAGGETIRLSDDIIKCPGGKIGFGFRNGPMEIPGGYGHFVSYGAGEGAPPGMRLKSSPELAEQGAQSSPENVLEGCTIIEIKPYEQTDDPDLVTVLASADQLSALNLLFNFRRTGNESAYFPTGSACSSVFLLPFSELRREEPRAVIGNADISVRPYFEADTLFFTVSGQAFREMLQDADESFLIASAWKKLKPRIHVD